MHLGIGDSFYLVGKVRDTYSCSLSLTWELLCDIMFAVSSSWRIGSCCLKIWICWNLLWTHKLPPPSSSKTPRRHHHHGGCCFLMKLDNNNHLQLKLKFGKPRPVLWTTKRIAKEKCQIMYSSSTSLWWRYREDLPFGYRTPIERLMRTFFDHAETEKMSRNDVTVDHRCNGWFLIELPRV